MPLSKKARAVSEAYKACAIFNSIAALANSATLTPAFLIASNIFLLIANSKSKANFLNFVICSPSVLKGDALNLWNVVGLGVLSLRFWPVCAISLFSSFSSSSLLYKGLSCPKSLRLSGRSPVINSGAKATISLINESDISRPKSLLKAFIRSNHSDDLGAGVGATLLCLAKNLWKSLSLNA